MMNHTRQLCALTVAVSSALVAIPSRAEDISDVFGIWAEDRQQCETYVEELSVHPGAEVKRWADGSLTSMLYVDAKGVHAFDEADVECWPEDRLRLRLKTDLVCDNAVSEDIDHVSLRIIPEGNSAIFEWQDRQFPSTRFEYRILCLTETELQSRLGDR